MQLKKVFPIYEGAELRRRWTHEAEWQDWLRAHGAYGFRVAPYYNRCVVVFGEKRYVEVIKQLYGLDESEYVAGVGGMVTDLGYIQYDTNVHCVYLPENYNETVYWHEALHIALITGQHHDLMPSDQEAFTYLQGYIVEEFVKARVKFLADKKAGGLPAIQDIVTRHPSTIRRGGYQFIRPERPKSYESALRVFQRHFRADPGDNESIVKELFSMSENRRRRALVDLVADYHKNSSLAKAGRNRGTTVQDIADSLVDEASIVKLLKDIHNLSFTSPLYGVYRNPDFGRELPDMLPLLAFDNQPLNTPLDLARIS